MLKKMPGWLKLTIKIGVSLLCLWYVSRKIDWTETWRLLEDSNKMEILLAAIFFMNSKLVSAKRLNIYFRNINIRLSEKTNNKLYWLGMFYNLFLPGGIGGDAYKVILLQKKGFSPSYKLCSAAVLLDRISGVAGLAILASACYFILFQPLVYAWVILSLIVPGVALYYVFVRKFFPSFIQGFNSTLLLGLAVQLLQIACVWMIMESINIQGHFFAFQFIFLLSSIVAILPFTIGGLGAREIVFLWGATQFGLNEHEAVFISILFYLITVIVSLVGIIWVYRDPLKNEKPAVQLQNLPE